MSAKKEFIPAYGKLSSKELEHKTGEAQKRLASCNLCPWECRVDRPSGERGRCRSPAEAVVASYSPHFGEEPELVGMRGSGTIFFAHCNLECIFCQNWDISQEGAGRAVSPEALADIMLQLQKRGCHNINLVTPTPHVAVILEALGSAVEKGLHLPLVYNCGGYESPETLRLLEGVVDIYMPDFKYWEEETARDCSGPPDYPRRAREALKEMQRQVGDLQTDERGIAYRGLLVRHLVLPQDLGGTSEVIRFLAEEISPRCASNIMRQYYPAYRVGDYSSTYPALSRPLQRQEYEEARKAAAAAGLRLLK